MLSNGSDKLKFWRKTHMKKQQKYPKRCSHFGDSPNSPAKTNNNTYATFCKHIVKSLKLDGKLFLDLCDHVNTILGDNCLTMANVITIVDAINFDQKDET